LQEITLPLKQTKLNTSNSSFAGHSNCTHPGYTLRSIHFSPYHPEETITNFIIRLEVFSHPKNQDPENKNKVYRYTTTSLLLNCINNFMILVPIIIIVSVIEEYVEILDVFEMY
jgi:hypothetical protein